MYKSIAYSVKGIDEAKGIIEGYASAFGNIDSDGDVLVKGAFTKTISERGPAGKNQIYHLAQHDSTKILGKPLELMEDDYGLKFVSQISKTTLGKDYLQLYLDGIINEHSIGFNTIKNDMGRDANYIKEVKLWEYSAVTWGANEMTPTLSAKSATDRLVKMTKAFRNGNYSDDTFQMLEVEIERLSDLIKSLTDINVTPTEPTDVKDEPIVESLSSFINNLKQWNK